MKSIKTSPFEITLLLAVLLTLGVGGPEAVCGVFVGLWLMRRWTSAW